MRRLAFFVGLIGIVLSAEACGGDDFIAVQGTGAAGGSSGAAGSASGQSGASGASGDAGSGGRAGSGTGGSSSGGQSGAGGDAGSAGSGGSSGTSAGNGGASGEDGGAGSTGAGGSSGSSGSGGSGGNAASSGSGGSGGSGGTASDTCDQLRAQVRAKLAEAQACCAVCAIANQCSAKAPGLCCEETLNSADSPASRAYLEALGSYNAKNCLTPCTDAVCPSVPSHLCNLNGSCR